MENRKYLHSGPGSSTQGRHLDIKGKGKLDLLNEQERKSYEGQHNSKGKGKMELLNEQERKSHEHQLDFKGKGNMEPLMEGERKIQGFQLDMNEKDKMELIYKQTRKKNFMNYLIKSYGQKLRAYGYQFSNHSRPNSPPRIKALYMPPLYTNNMAFRTPFEIAESKRKLLQASVFSLPGNETSSSSSFPIPMRPPVIHNFGHNQSQQNFGKATMTMNHPVGNFNSGVPQNYQAGIMRSRPAMARGPRSGCVPPPPKQKSSTSSVYFGRSRGGGWNEYDGMNADFTVPPYLINMKDFE